MQSAEWYERCGDALQRVTDTARARDAEELGTPGREKAEAAYQDALATYRAIAAQAAMRGPDPV